MASTREVSSIAEELWCPVCLSIFQDPRMLGCGHSFCLACLESCISSEGHHDGSCPECQTPFSLQEAAHNRVLANLSQKARLLTLEGTPQSGGRGSVDVCKEHNEPLKLFCCQDEAPICRICQDLPQHQSHSILPIKNAVRVYQDKLKASLEPLEDGVKWATKNQSLQLETIEDLECLYQNLCGLIFFAFEELREILNEQEQAMMETVKQMKEDNQADMENRLEYLTAYESSHKETISSIQVALEETNTFAFLKGIKGLMGRVQEHLREEKEEAESDNIQEAKESEEKEDGEKEAGEEEEEDGKRDEAIPDEWEACCEESPDTKVEDEEGTIIPVDPSLRELEVSLDFEAWKEMLRSISIREADAPGFPYCSPPQEENMLQSEGGGVSEGAKEKAAPIGEKCSSTTEVSASAPGEVSCERERACSSRSSAVKSTPYQPPLCVPPFPLPVFQQWPIFSNVSVRGGMTAITPRWNDGLMTRGRGYPQRLPPGFVARQGRGYHPNLQRFQSHATNFGHPENWKSPRTERPHPRGAYARRQGGGGSNKQNTPSHGRDPSGQSGGDVIKQEMPKSGEVPVLGEGRGQLNHRGLPPSRSVGSGDGEGKSTNKQGFKPRGRSTSRQGGPGRLQGAAKKPPTPQKQGDTPGNKGSPSQAKPSHPGGRGSGSAKGPQKK
ncbi:hypothetical protein JRQ81_003451 [Phrynocephalus forsythii]|uniref:Uncharacterized protein n=1 Tax=Phrynocephalus forsythii TaxID=171643 RepID=A0A9Q0XJX3_9SAUR|nr:hypothetical protein JRQ81_003451 [Phrynocephalus forsythii]